MRVTPWIIAALLLAPLAAADHVFSHRVIITGRILDADGRPAAGVAVNVSSPMLQLTADCFDSMAELTGPRGDYEICRHVHALGTNVTVWVEAAGTDRRVLLDPDLRHAVGSFTLGTGDVPHDVGGERLFPRTFLVAGRAFALLPAPAEAENVPVNATPLRGNVSVELRSADSSLANATVPIDEFGSYRADLDVTAIPAGAVVRASVGNDMTEELADPTFRRADVNVVRDLRLAHGPGADAPGSTTAAPPFVALAALALAGAIGAAARRRTR